VFGDDDLAGIQALLRANAGLRIVFRSTRSRSSR